jgi:tyrosyl-tRNA synthetase
MDDTIDAAELDSEFLRDIARRGLIHQCTDLVGLDELLVSERVSAYIGFDCTAPSLHVGSLVPLTLLRLLQRHGHRPIVVMGGGTTKIGDPSDKDEQRPLLTDEEIAANKAGILGVIEQFLTFGDGPSDAVVVDNAEWLEPLRYIDFLRTVGAHFTVNRMLSFESVKRRLDREQPMTLLEFNYMVLQAYDFVQLGQRFGCRLQMGGSDQWGNIVSGVELARRLDGQTYFGLTGPLLTTASGEKMGKTASGAIWLDAQRLSPFEFWQYWRNVDDVDVGWMLRAFTDLPADEIERLDRLEGQERNEAKKVLASELTSLCHGPEAAARAAETARRTFEQGQIGRDLPTTQVPRAELSEGIPAFDLMRRVGLCKTGGEARRLIKQRGGRINDVVIDDPLRPVTLGDLTEDGVIKLSAGKKRHALVRPV